MKDLYVVATDPDTGEVFCSCGARATKHESKRFLKRHPKLCSERRSFAMQLARDTRSVDYDDQQAKKPGRVGLI